MALIYQGIFIILEQHVFCILIDYRGRHRKGVAIYSLTRSIYNKKPWFHWAKNVFLNTTEKFKHEKCLLIDIIFAMRFCSNHLFRAAPYRLMLVLHKDVLFNCMPKLTS